MNRQKRASTIARLDRVMRASEVARLRATTTVVVAVARCGGTSKQPLIWCEDRGVYRVHNTYLTIAPTPPWRESTHRVGTADVRLASRREADCLCRQEDRGERDPSPCLPGAAATATVTMKVVRRNIEWYELRGYRAGYEWCQSEDGVYHPVLLDGTPWRRGDEYTTGPNVWRSEAAFEIGLRLPSEEYGNQWGPPVLAGSIESGARGLLMALALKVPAWREDLHR